MIPTSTNLLGYKNKTLTIDTQLLGIASSQVPGRMPLLSNKSCTLTGSGGGITLSKTEGTTDGIYIPYKAGQAVVGFAAGGQTWAASGQFNGCGFTVGKAGGRIFASHISVESGSEGDTQYKAWRTANSAQEWYWNNIKVTDAEVFYFCAMFAVWGGDGLTSLARIDVESRDLRTGTIFGVKVLK